MLTVGSLFAGIGGIECGLEATGGFKIIWQVEVDSFCRRILEKHWPEVPKYGDIREYGARELARPDVLAGGFPCQNLSTAGLREGLRGAQSGLWYEYLRLIRELQPRYVIAENVAGIRYVKEAGEQVEPAALATVLGGLAQAGYDAEWTSLYAFQFGYPHYRERCFLVAYPTGGGRARLFSHVPVQRKPPRPGDVSKLDWNSRLLETFEQRVCESAIFGENPGIPYRAQRLRVLGNAVMPAMAQLIGECILLREALLQTDSH